MKDNPTPAYQTLLHSGEMQRRVNSTLDRLQSCCLCPHQCGVNRLNDERGTCRIGRDAVVSSFGAHQGEEKPLSGWHGSGTIFFSGCNLRCVFCQNAEISQTIHGRQTSTQDLAAIMLSLQSRGCHNINLVSPSHVVPQVIQALYLAAQNGLRLPVVFNSGGYDSVDTLKLLEGVIDIYMPDMKYADAEVALRYSGAADYPAINQKAVSEMHRQTGDLLLDDQGLAIKGLLVRHLLMPENLAGTDEILKFLAEKISKQTAINLMDQYYPAHHVHRYPELNRRVTRAESQQALQQARSLGLQRLL